jgi:hypothetical protein
MASGGSKNLATEWQVVIILATDQTLNATLDDAHKTRLTGLGDFEVLEFSTRQCLRD